jgi:hypothetical protein
MEKEPTEMSPKKAWPANKSLPKFKSLAEEERFWRQHQPEDAEGQKWEEVVYEPRATTKPRAHVYRVRFDDQEMAILQALAKRRGVTASTILREMVRGASSKRKAS